MNGETPTDTGTTAGASLTPPPAPADPTGQQPAGNAPQPDQATEAETIESLPAWAQKEIRNLRDENKRRRQDAAAAKAKADEDRLAEQQKWQELAERRSQELTAARARIDELTAVADRVMDSANAEIAKWPEEVRSMKPAEATAAGLLAWMETARPLVARLTAPAPAPGAGPTPKPSTPGALTNELRQRAAERIARTF